MKVFLAPLLASGLAFNVGNADNSFLYSARKSVFLQRVEDFKEEQKLKDLLTKEEEVVETVEEVNIPRSYYNLWDITEPSNITYDELYSYLIENTELAKYTNDYLEAGKEYGINPIILTSITLLESGRGTSNITYSHNNVSGTMLYNGSEYVYKYFDSISECIYYTARNLRENYIEQDGVFYTGSSLISINERYCPPNPSWSVEINKISGEIIEYMGEF